MTDDVYCILEGSNVVRDYLAVINNKNKNVFRVNRPPVYYRKKNCVEYSLLNIFLLKII